MSNWKYFTLAQINHSDTANSKHITNVAPESYYSHIDGLITNILDPLRDAWGSGIIISSGYRCEKLNKELKGAANSAHLYGYAADLVVSSGRLEEFKQFCMKWLLDNNIAFDQYINEYSSKSSWVHIGFKNGSGQQRKEYLLYRGGKYTTIDPRTFKGVNNTSGSISSTNTTQTTTTVTTTPRTTNSDGTVTTSTTWQSTTSDVGYGILTGRNIYLNDIDLQQIQDNDIYVKDESGMPIIDETTGLYKITDSYLLEDGLDDHTMDEIESADELESEPDEGFDDFFNSITAKTEEKVSGISYKADGTYVLEQSSTLREFMQMFWQWWELVQTLKRACEHYQKTKVERKEARKEKDSQYVCDIDAEVITKAAFDKLGHVLRNGVICPVCGKRVKYLTFGGYCSSECMLKDVANKVMGVFLAPNDRYKDLQEIITEICQLLDYITLLINATACIPDIIKELAHIPERYKKYVKTKICEGFCELNVLIKKAMVKKNKLMAKFYEKIKLGIILKPFAYVNVAIQTVHNALIEVQKAFDTVYAEAMNFLEPLLKNGGGIDGESFAWCATPRSFISTLPVSCGGDKGKLFVNLPGGSGAPTLALIKPIKMGSGMCNIDFAAIEAIIQSLFPPLTPFDYYLEPDLFEIRFLFSDQSDLVAQIRQQLADLLVGGPDYIPSFENLLPMKKYTNVTIAPGVIIPEAWLPNVGYVWFLLGLADAWGPHSQSLVGSVINPLV